MVETNAPTLRLGPQELIEAKTIGTTRFSRLTQLLSDYETKLAFVRSKVEKQKGISDMNRKFLFEYYRRIDSEFWDIDIPSTLRDRARRYLDSIERLEHLCGYVVKTA